MGRRTIGCGFFANPVNDWVFMNPVAVRIVKVFCKALEQKATVIALVVLEHGLADCDLLAVNGNNSMCKNDTMFTGVSHAALVDSNTVRCTATVIMHMAVVERVC